MTTSINSETLWNYKKIYGKQKVEKRKNQEMPKNHDNVPHICYTFVCFVAKQIDQRKCSLKHKESSQKGIINSTREIYVYKYIVCSSRWRQKLMNI